jgi:GTPase SAR1 family protein
VGHGRAGGARQRPTAVIPEHGRFLICFPVAGRPSFNNVRDKWVDEIKQYSSDPVILLVGTKGDLRAAAKEPVGQKEAKDMALKIGAFDYVECSAAKCQGVNDVFDKAIFYAVNPPREKGCCRVQ